MIRAMDLTGIDPKFRPDLETAITRGRLRVTRLRQISIDLSFYLKYNDLPE